MKEEQTESNPWWTLILIMLGTIGFAVLICVLQGGAN